MDLKQIKPKKGVRKFNAAPILQSRKAEIAYTRELLALVAYTQSEIKKDLIPMLKRYSVGDASAVQVSDRFIDEFIQALAALRNRILLITDTMAIEIARRIVEQNRQSTDQQLANMLLKFTGIDFTALMRSEDLFDAVNDAIHANVQLIKSIPSQHLDKVEQIVLNGIQSGLKSEFMVKAIQGIGHSTEKRAKLIARDQTGKLTSKLTEVRQTKLGITHYYWSCSRDERVRDSHLARDGKLYAWTHVHDDGHPGIPIRCRCVAIPYTAHLFDPNAPTPEEIIAMQEAA
ncbi:minor capsid protein [Acinetobacter indicus]|uniref:phage head morphogenesis protein n=1 Tax=Acinetobacter indicus TaxID=756892 RepID=UPI000CEB6896|nr:minor capsid protein [Acinetobacter indicus]AVH14379.1 hypothetical protein CTZ23_08810 [Acinetobacter indicus]